MRHSANLRRLLLLLLVLILVAPIDRARADAADPIAALTTEPGEIQVNRFDHAAVDALVIARGTGVALPAQLALSFTASPGLTVAVGARIDKGGDAVWPVNVRATGDPVDQGGVDFRLDYYQTPAATPDASATPRVQRARLVVKVAPGRDASPVDDAELTIKMDSRPISERAKSKAYLQIKNKSNYPFVIEEPEIDTPSFLQAKIAPIKRDVRARETLLVPFDLQIRQGSKPQIGEWLILVKAMVSRGDAATRRTGTAVAEAKVKVEVPGVSDVLKVLDLPSLLLIPGALVVAAWSLFFGAAEAAKPKWLEWKSSNFWLIAVTLSILIFGALSLTQSGPDFLVEYSLSDVAELWLFCVGGGAITCLLYRGGVAGLAAFRAHRAEAERRKHEPLFGDEPIDILNKLALAKLPFYLKSYTRTDSGGQKQEIFDTEFRAADGRAWVVPRMLPKVKVSDERTTQLLQRIYDANNKNSQQGLRALTDAVAEGRSQDLIDLTWEPGDVRHPRLLPADKLGDPMPDHSPVADV